MNMSKSITQPVYSNQRNIAITTDSMIPATESILYAITYIARSLLKHIVMYSLYVAYNYKNISATVDSYNKSVQLFSRLIPLWNSLHSELVDAPTSEQFMQLL